jgi:hypothetical protein
MNTLPRSSTSRDFDPIAIRALVNRGKELGLIRTGEPLAPARIKLTAPVAALDQPGESVQVAGAMRTVWTDVTPEQAAAWLENNFVNRPLKDDVVQAYARDMVNGVWVPTHQGVAFNDANALIDGQHRLSAIVLTGLTVRMMVTYGLPAKIKDREMTTMDAVDRGRTRSVADQLTIQHGMKNGAITAAVSMSLAGLCYGERTRRLSVGQTLDVFRAFEDAVTWVILHRVKEHGLKAAGVLAGFAFAMATEKENLWDGTTEIQQMYDRVVSGKDLREGTAMKALRTFLTSDEAKLLTRGTDRGVAELVLNGIHLEQQGKKVDKLTLHLDGANHFRALQPDRVAKIAAMFRLPEVKR